MSKNIGLIDDSRVMRSILRKSILMCHYKVDRCLEAENGLEGFKMLSENQETLDLAFLDLHMPEMSGVEMLKKLQDGKLGPVPITSFSAPQALEKSEECTDFGAGALNRKPFQPPVGPTGKRAKWCPETGTSRESSNTRTALEWSGRSMTRLNASRTVQARHPLSSQGSGDPCPQRRQRVTGLFDTRLRILTQKQVRSSS